jgi:hypothetical protein
VLQHQNAVGRGNGDGAARAAFADDHGNDRHAEPQTALRRAGDGLRLSALFRADAGLAMVVVSDAYDNSGTRPEDVMSAVTSKWGGNKPFVFHSIVVPQSQYTDPSRTSVIAGDPCGSYRESVQYDGREYHRLSDMTGGVKGTVCSDNYSAQLANMGKVTAELVNSVTLNCQPIDYNKDGKIDGGDVQVFTAAGAAVLDFTVTGTKVTLTNGLPIGSNQVKYYCAQ